LVVSAGSTPFQIIDMMGLFQDKIRAN